MVVGVVKVLPESIIVSLQAGLLSLDVPIFNLRQSKGIQFT
jgi:hypothetical protein